MFTKIHLKLKSKEIIIRAKTKGLQKFLLAP